MKLRQLDRQSGSQAIEAKAKYRRKEESLFL